jgi:hypothetical protein
MYDIGKRGKAKKVMHGVLPASENNEQNTQAPNKLNTPFRLSDADMEIRGISSTRQKKTEAAGEGDGLILVFICTASRRG